MTAPEPSVIGVITEQNDLGLGFSTLTNEEAEAVAPKKSNKKKKDTEEAAPEE